MCRSTNFATICVNIFPPFVALPLSMCFLRGMFNTELSPPHKIETISNCNVKIPQQYHSFINALPEHIATFIPPQPRNFRSTLLHLSHLTQRTPWAHCYIYPTSANALPEHIATFIPHQQEAIKVPLRQKSGSSSCCRNRVCPNVVSCSDGQLYWSASLGLSLASFTKSVLPLFLPWHLPSVY